MTDEIRLERHRGVARVTIDRPQVLNALDEKASERCNEIWREIEADPGVRAVVLTGAGTRAFCAGADMSSPPAQDGATFWDGMDPNGFAGLTLRRTLDVPVIARVNGYAMGGGMELVLGCDIVIAADTAQFAFPEPRVGRLPMDGGVVELLRRVPRAAAMGMLLTGRRYSAAQLASIGLVNEVVTAQELDAAVDRWVADVLSCAPTSLRAIKQIWNRTRHLSASDARLLRLPAVEAALASPNGVEGVRAFQQRRPPVWSDR